MSNINESNTKRAVFNETAACEGLSVIAAFKSVSSLLAREQVSRNRVLAYGQVAF